MTKILSKPTSSAHLKLIVRRLKKKNLEKELRGFVAASRPSREVSRPGHKLAVNYLVDRIRKIDPLKTGRLRVDQFIPPIGQAVKNYQAEFEKLKKLYSSAKVEDEKLKAFKKVTDSYIAKLSKLKSTKGQNIIWEKQGTSRSKEVLILGAHYDTIGIDKDGSLLKDSVQPGADNNATGVASLLSLIEVLTALDIPKTVRVIFFDFEELGLLGSKSYIRKYAKSLKNEKISGFINLDMLGHDSKRLDKDKRFGNFKAYTRKSTTLGGKSDIEFFKVIDKLGKKMTRKVNFTLSDNGFSSSSQKAFWQAGIPAIWLSQNWEVDLNPRYHSKNDFTETLNLKTWFSSFQYIGYITLAWTFDISR